MTYTLDNLKTMSDDDLGVLFYHEFGVNFDDPKEMVKFISSRDITVNFLMGTVEGFCEDGSAIRCSHDFTFKALACVCLMMERG